MEKNTFIIAEAGVNHNGDVDFARQLVDVAKEAGADAVKFQTFQAENLVTPTAEKARYQKQNTDSNPSQLSMLQKLQISDDDHRELQQHCNDIGIEFLSTPFDLICLKFLVIELGVQKIKISSGDITNGPLLHACAQLGCETILSTGMSTMQEIQDALGVLAHGYSSQHQPCKKAFAEAYSSESGKKVLQQKVTLLHCTSQYPAPYNELNLNSIPYMKEMFGLSVGYSDHSEGIAASIAAVAIGAEVIEKHFTLDKNMDGPDHKASLVPEELQELVSSIRAVNQAMGKSEKKVQASELETMQHARKSIVASQNIGIGETISEDNITTKRPATGRSPMEYWEILGLESNQEISKNARIP